MPIEEKEEVLTVWLPESIKYRLDRATVEDRTTLKAKVTKILDEALPQYELI